MICYNDYGVLNPEGVVETPRRLPKCKHTFGNKCLKKWLKSADSCPYCRDKLPSTFRPLHRHIGRVTEEIESRRSSFQPPSVSGGTMTAEDMEFMDYDPSDAISGFIPNHLRARALAMDRRLVPTGRNSDTPLEVEETRQDPAEATGQSPPSDR